MAHAGLVAMAERWSGWEAGIWASPRSPYVNFLKFIRAEGHHDGGGDGGDGERIRFQDYYVPRIARRMAGHESLPDLGADYDEVAVPDFALNADFGPYFDAHGWAPDPDELPQIGDDTVIVGVVDRAIALAHNRLRMADGGTRVLAAWQQNGARSGTASARDGVGLHPWLPFGTELYQADIDQLIAKHTCPGGAFDETSFNVNAGLLDLSHARASRQLAGRVAHGAHVMDLAAGHDPTAADEETLRRTRLIAVTLPDRTTIHASGAYLSYYALYAIYRITALADAIWAKNHPNELEDAPGPRGYPIVMNMSFGVQAGPKDMTGLFDRQLAALREIRARKGFRPFELVIPVGNDNLERVRASYALDPGAGRTMCWSVMPEDQSSNFLDIRAARVPAGQIKRGGRVPVKIAVRAAGERARARAGKRDHVSTLGNNARIYCAVRDIGEGFVEVHYLVCLAPTIRNDLPCVTSAPGAWEIEIENAADVELDIEMTVQSDQSRLPASKTGRRSYLYSEGYRLFTDDGHWRDSYTYGGPGEPEDIDYAGPVWRHGTMTDTSIDREVIAAAGYRRGDGQPAKFSSTGFRKADEAARQTPSVALPAEDAVTLFGTLAAGAANGSVVAMLGTSFASALAAREATETYLRDPDADAAAELDAKAMRDEAAKGSVADGCHFVADADPKKVGVGRVASKGVLSIRRL